MVAELLSDALPLVFYGAAIALGVWASLKTHIHTQAILTLVSTGIFLLGYTGINKNMLGDPDSDLGVLFLIMFPCTFFTLSMWFTTTARMLINYFKSLQS